MSDFTPVVVKKDGKTDRIARTPVELVQFQYDGYKVAREASKTAIEKGTSVVKVPQPDPDPKPEPDSQ